MATSKKAGAKEKRVTKQQKLLAEVVAQKGSARAVAEELVAQGQGLKCSQQSVDAWIKGHWPPRIATQALLKRLYDIPMPWSRA